MTTDKFILRNKRVVKAKNLMEWANFFEYGENRRVAYDIVGKKEVSTVFLGLDHNFMGNKLHIFETMIFPEAEVFDRYATWKEAEAGHKRAVKSLK